MKEIRFLGTGSAFNTDLGNTALYIKEDSDLLLIDCGETVFKKIINLNVLDNVSNINIVLTHFHSDHVGSLGTLILYCYFNLKIKPNVYFPNTKTLSDFLDINLGDDFYNIKQDNRVLPIKTTHCEELECYSYLIKLENKTIFYSGDSNDLSFYKNDIVKNDILCFQEICEKDYENNIHTGLDKFVNLIPSNYYDNIYCMHLDSQGLIDKLNDHGIKVASEDYNYY